MERIDAKGRRVLLIPDLHIPYHHVDAFKFLSAIKEKYVREDTIIICLGDEIDGHAISFHDSDVELFSAGHELDLSIDFIHRKDGLFSLFPFMSILTSNHGSLIYRRAKHHGIPMEALKSYSDILKTPTWYWFDEIILETKLGNVFLCHGRTGSYGKLAKEEGCSAIQGHFHGKFEITWHKTANSERFNMFCGCLINRESLAFAYGRNHLPKPILGAGLLSESGYPRLIKMHLNSKNRWDGKLP